MIDIFIHAIKFTHLQNYTLKRNLVALIGTLVDSTGMSVRKIGIRILVGIIR